MVVHLVDGTYELFRHFYGGAAAASARTGRFGAVVGVLHTVLQMIETGATHVGVATDHVIESFRNELWPGYKTGAGIDPALLAQFQPLEEALAAMGVDGLADGRARGRRRARGGGARRAPPRTRGRAGAASGRPTRTSPSACAASRVVQVDRRAQHHPRRRRRAREVRRRARADPRLPRARRRRRRRLSRASRASARSARHGSLNRHGAIEAFPAEVLGEQARARAAVQGPGDAENRRGAVRRRRRAALARADGRIRRGGRALDDAAPARALPRGPRTLTRTSERPGVGWKDVTALTRSRDRGRLPESADLRWIRKSASPAGTGSRGRELRDCDRRDAARTSGSARGWSDRARGERDAAHLRRRPGDDVPERDHVLHVLARQRARRALRAVGAADAAAAAAAAVPGPRAGRRRAQRARAEPRHPGARRRGLVLGAVAGARRRVPARDPSRGRRLPVVDGRRAPQLPRPGARRPGGRRAGRHRVPRGPGHGGGRASRSPAATSALLRPAPLRPRRRLRRPLRARPRARDARYGIPAARTATIPHALYDHHAAPRPAHASDDGVCRLLYLGVIRPFKGVEDLVRAFDLLERRRGGALPS